MWFDGKDITSLKQLSQDSRPDKTKVDPINRLLFFTDDGRNAISSLNLDGSNFQDVITSGLDYPRGITLDPKAKKIYWTDWGENPKIESASYDGTDRQLLINTDIKWPNSIAIDSDNNRLYFVDGSLGKIESCDLSGGDRQVILRDNGAHFYSIDVFGAYIYYTDWARSTPMRLNKDGSGLTALGAASFQQLSEIKVYQYKNDTTGAATASPLALSPRQTFLRLVGIKDSTNGRLEIYANGQWGTICVDQWTDNEAKVACHMMGFNRSLARSTSFYPSELEMAMNSFDQVHCSGNEDHIVYCNVTANNWDVHDCSKLGVAGVKCENDYNSGVLDPALDNFILFNDVFEGQLVRMDTETFSYTTAALQFSNFTPIAIAFDPLAQKVYFSEVKGNTSLIRQTDLRGQILNTLGSTPDGSVINGMVVDTRQDIIFYTDAGNRRIASIKPDGSNYLVVSSDVDQPKGLAIDKNSGYYIDNRLYVTGHGFGRLKTEIGRLANTGRNLYTGGLCDHQILEDCVANRYWRIVWPTDTGGLCGQQILEDCVANRYWRIVWPTDTGGLCGHQILEDCVDNRYWRIVWPPDTGGLCGQQILEDCVANTTHGRFYFPNFHNQLGKISLTLSPRIRSADDCSTPLDFHPTIT
ncbi:hypothetical protein Btru_050135 [Bulinus truncatus]|nr:hypothetical protein Btru_050135 [Bulinus truncatus]